MKCPYCKKQIDMKQKLTPTQEIICKEIDESNPYPMPEHKDYYCDCGGHLTLIKQKKKWIVATGSKQ